MLTRLSALWLALGLALGCAIGGSFVDWSLSRPPYQKHQTVGENQHNEDTPNNNRSAFFNIGAWADDNHAAIEALSTFGVFVFTIALVVSTLLLWKAGENQLVIAERTANAAMASAEHIPRVERAYLTGGGPVRTLPGGQREFRIEVENHGKTPAYLCAFDVHFSTLMDVREGPQEVFPVRLFDDRIKPGGHLKPLDWIPFTRQDADVIYGAFWYQDLLKREHIFRFILRIDRHTDETHVGIAGVDDSYTYWD
jgi:hypothetical protein